MMGGELGEWNSYLEINVVMEGMKTMLPTLQMSKYDERLSQNGDRIDGGRFR